MNVDCQWIEKHLEGLFSGSLSEDERRLARDHMEACGACAKEVQALRAIDPLIKTHFRRELQIAQRPRAIHKARVFGLSSAAAAAVITLVLLLTRYPGMPPAIAPSAASDSTATLVSPPAEPPVKVEDAGDIIRTKPTAESSAEAADRRQPAPQRVTPNSPDFLVIDPAGYGHTLEEYRGHAVLIAVWTHDQAGSIASVERIYKANADNPRLRFLGVSTEHRPRPANTTFPILYNQGSKLLGAKPGEFVLLDETGTVELRGSLSRDLDNLQTALETK